MASWTHFSFWFAIFIILYSWICAGNVELMKLLLSKGVDIESQSDAGTPLIWAAGHGQPDAVKFLLEHDAKVSFSSISKLYALVDIWVLYFI